MHDGSDERRDRLGALVWSRKVRTVFPGLIDETSRPEELLGSTDTEQMLAEVRAQDRFHQTWHRVWGVRLRGEMLEMVDRLATALGSEPVFLVWKRNPAAAMRVDAARALRCVAPALAMSLRSRDLQLLADGGASGVALGCTHGGTADEYELLTWGRFAVDLSAAAAGAGSTT